MMNMAMFDETDRGHMHEQNNTSQNMQLSYPELTYSLFSSNGDCITR